MKFEIEVQSLSEAQERIAEIRNLFGTDDITVRVVSGNKEKLLNTLDDGAKKLFEDIKKAIKKKMEDDKNVYGTNG